MNVINKAAVLAMVLGWPAIGICADGGSGEAPAWIKGHVEVGARVSYFLLRDDHRDFYGGNRFYGSINDLDVRQIYLPVKLFVAYKFNPYVGAELSLERLDVGTWSRPNPQEGAPWTDGTIKLWGPLASVYARYPNATRFTPYAGIGLACFFADFDFDAAWHHPASVRPDYDPTFYQDFQLDDTLAWLVYGGLTANLAEHWALDFQVRYMKMDLDGVTLTSRSGGDYFENGKFTFPLSNVSFGLGLRYMF